MNGIPPPPHTHSKAHTHRRTHIGLNQADARVSEWFLISSHILIHLSFFSRSLMQGLFWNRKGCLLHVNKKKTAAQEQTAFMSNTDFVFKEKKENLHLDTTKRLQAHFKWFLFCLFRTLLREISMYPLDNHYFTMCYAALSLATTCCISFSMPSYTQHHLFSLGE